ncbi:MAG: OmpH family outer membrane protein [Bacteroidaceae bacterium]|nr:OmpH family outer membrane protein [Bacteroidaceae bacterium]
MKKFLTLVALMLTCAGIQAQDVTATDQQAEAQTLPAEGQPATVVVNQTMKFGYLSYSQVLEAMDGYADTQKTIAALRQAYEQELARSEEVFSKQFSEYVDGQKSFPDNIRLKRQKELQQTMEQSLQFKQEAKALLKQKEEAALDVLRARLNGVISEIGTERGYAFVLNTDNNAYPFVNGGLGDDITNEVLTRLNTK